MTVCNICCVEIIVPGEALLLTTVEALERWGISGGPALKLSQAVEKMKGGNHGTFQCYNPRPQLQFLTNTVFRSHNREETKG